MSEVASHQQELANKSTPQELPRRAASRLPQPSAVVSVSEASVLTGLDPCERRIKTGEANPVHGSGDVERWWAAASLSRTSTAVFWDDTEILFVFYRRLLEEAMKTAETRGRRLRARPHGLASAGPHRRPTPAVAPPSRPGRPMPPRPHRHPRLHPTPRPRPSRLWQIRRQLWRQRRCPPPPLPPHVLSAPLPSLSQPPPLPPLPYLPSPLARRPLPPATLSPSPGPAPLPLAPPRPHGSPLSPLKRGRGRPGPTLLGPS